MALLGGSFEVRITPEGQFSRLVAIQDVFLLELVRGLVLLVLDSNDEVVPTSKLVRTGAEFAQLGDNVPVFFHLEQGLLLVQVEDDPVQSQVEVFDRNGHLDHLEALLELLIGVLPHEELSMGRQSHQVALERDLADRVLESLNDPEVLVRTLSFQEEHLLVLR
eukprot:CAMPEP_0170554648 /NCGR_PEP_ID=MMETSP0211-20121228/12523_1 /TAXON_ID=311385 /ORGANISM="Pseudokeronopsis sp., Strain OXSARD2" /LENGTH=163 /DNA_ID=CAMNT_0010863895 /DNA_START=773 /DNA_END=1264 /DNA_ORIENTATION=-